MSFWNGRNVLVTGAAGFIGSHLVETLVEQGARVTALVHYDNRSDHGNLEFVNREVRSKIKIMLGDICDPFLVRKAVEGMDTVFHLAALIAIPYSYIAPQSYIRVNVEGTLNVLEACRSEKVRCMVHTSTSETYGTAQYTPIDEKHPLVGQSPYSASKIGADKIVESYRLSFEMPVVTLRPFNTYGPRQSARAVIPTIICQAISTNPSIKLGSLSPVRDFNFVKDTASAFLAAAENESCLGLTLNAGSGTSFTIGETVNLIQDILGMKKPVETQDQRIRPEGSEVFTLIANSNLLREKTGWKPQFTFKQGLQQSIEFVRSNPQLFRANEYVV